MTALTYEFAEGYEWGGEEFRRVKKSRVQGGDSFENEKVALEKVSREETSQEITNYSRSGYQKRQTGKLRDMDEPFSEAKGTAGVLPRVRLAGSREPRFSQREKRAKSILLKIYKGGGGDQERKEESLILENPQGGGGLQVSVL